MDGLLVCGIILMVLFIFGEFAFAFHAVAAYKKLRNEIISKGKLKRKYFYIIYLSDCQY